MFKIALDAGHGLSTPGKRCLKSIDPNETREWTLNSRIAEKVEEKLKDYSGYQLLRVDDPTGKTDVALKTRTDKANNWEADLYLSVHHNAGINGGTGGGITAYTYFGVDQKTKDWQKTIYDSLIKYTNLKGNRSAPLAQADLHVCRETDMPAVLIENGFMDSAIDTPIILTEDFAEKSAEALVEVLVLKGNLKKNISKEENTAKPTDSSAEKISVIYQVWDDVKNCWLPEVTDLTDYAGIYGHDVCCLYAHLTSGNIFYKVHYKDGKWLPEVKNKEDYAGLYNKPIDALMMRTDTGKTIKYCVHLRRSNRWLPYVSGYDSCDFDNGYAGIIGQEIDGIKIYME